MYLHLFQEAIWPNGKFDSSSREVKSEKQKLVTKQQATRVLAEFFPGMSFSPFLPFFSHLLKLLYKFVNESWLN